MKIEKLEKNLRPSQGSTVKLKIMNHISEVKYLKKPAEIHIRKLDKDNYIELSTGEIKSITHAETRADDKISVSQSLRKLRDLINTNIKDTENCLWVTLTYAENMTDPVRLYNDFRKYNMRLQYYLKKKGYSKCEMIVCIEPQARGSFHAHILKIFTNEYPFIPNADLAKIWSHGYVKVKSLKNIDNVGLYLTCYLGDLELDENVILNKHKIGYIKEVEATDDDGIKKKKAIIKGGRLKLYTVGTHIFRTTKGIIRPITEECTEAEAMQKIGTAEMTYEKTIVISDDEGNEINTINYRHFNSKLSCKSIIPKKSE